MPAQIRLVLGYRSVKNKANKFAGHRKFGCPYRESKAISGRFSNSGHPALIALYRLLKSPNHAIGVWLSAECLKGNQL